MFQAPQYLLLLLPTPEELFARLEIQHDRNDQITEKLRELVKEHRARMHSRCTDLDVEAATNFYEGMFKVLGPKVLEIVEWNEQLRRDRSKID